jgi:RNA polymerase sigma factor (TIGR02999 family)
LIQRAQAGDGEALENLFRETYSELRELARARLRKGGRGTFLDTAALVHESYLRFADAGRLYLDDRMHFLCYVGQVMRSVIVDCVRERKADRHGGDAVRVTLSEQLAANRDGEQEILTVHEVLQKLARHDARMVQVVEMKYFGGLNEAQIAEALDVSERTVRRSWEKARMLLLEALE